MVLAVLTAALMAGGTGCRGDYRAVVTWRVPREQRGTVEVYEISADDGSRVNVVRVPVTLVPGR
ncbi:Gmad2 immunoglobulin-like domain-containing protein [Micromonospora musae]|uniref:Gmad2 immunoglobulin-like domain-containing protein n=1 Tax=Micromonospora musae TaxID=1894970 RepID=UPI0033DEFBE6